MNNKKRNRFRRVLAGLLSVVSAISLVGSPLVAYASEDTGNSSAYEAEVPELDDVRAQLTEDEIVTAEDIEVAYGDSFDAEEDFDGLSYNEDKVKITLHEAKSESGQSYSSNHADTYKAVYYVEPMSGNPVYRVTRNIIVKEPETSGASAVSESGDDGDDDSADAGDDDSDPALQVDVFGTTADTEAAAESESAVGSEATAESESVAETEANEEREADAESEATADSESASGTDPSTDNSVEDGTEASTDGTVDSSTEETGTADTETTDMDNGAETDCDVDVAVDADAETVSGADGNDSELETGSEVETEMEIETETDTAEALLGIMAMSLDEEEDETETGSEAVEEKNSGLNVNKSYVSGLAIKYLADGTAPFDDNDEVGNDSSSSNHIVRSFDYLNYTLEYTTALMNTSNTVDEAYMMVQFELDCDTSVAEFNTDSFNWCVDMVITYIYEDGSESTTLDSGKTVVKQILTGKRYLSKNGDSNAIPGAGTLSASIYVRAAQNGTVLQPMFTVWMEGNEESFYQSVTGDEVVVSAAPKYNICLARNGSLDYLGYFSLEEGTVYTSDADGLVYGRLEGYGIIVQLYNDSADKGLKGIELPTGDVTFDIVVTETLDGEDVTDSEDYTPYLWDYESSTSGNSNKKGTLGRWMAPGYIYNSSYACGVSPYNKGGGTAACYDGGSFTITQDESQKNVWHVTVKDYSFDEDDYEFPVRALGDSVYTYRYGANVGCFSAGYVEFLCSFARTVDSTSNLQLRVSADNLHAVSVSGQETTTEATTSDNAAQLNVTLYPRGSVGKAQWYCNESGSSLHSHWSYADAYTYQGATIQIDSRMSYGGDGYVTAYNLLQKFDDTAFEIPAGTSSYATYHNNQSPSDTTYDSINVLFAAKPDGTGWSSEDEMRSAREEDLIFFNTIDELNAAGYICVGYLYEVRGKIYAMSNGTDFYMNLTVKDTAEIGSVYMTTNDLRVWATEDAISWTEISYGSGAYGLGGSTGSYADGYATPDYISYSEYGKAVYEDGTIVSGHTGGYVAGNSILIIGCKTGVSIKVADTTATSTGTTSKSVYDLDAGERTVTYTIHPSVSVVSANREVESSDDTTTVTVKAELPTTLTYIMNSASLTPSDVTENGDGTSTITWVIENVKIGSDMEDITIACIIGDAGTADDVQNNDTITIAATITADKDSRRILAAYGNYSDTTISVIKLASTSVAKAVEKSLLEQGEEITYILRYGNSAEVDADGVKLFDILPYNGDGRDTSFSGDYVVDSITMDFSSAATTFETIKDSLGISYTTDEAARDADSSKAVLKGTDSLSWKAVSGASVNGTSTTWENLSLENVTGLLFNIGTVKAQEYIRITVTLAVKDSGGSLLMDANGGTQEPADIYANSFYQYASGQVAVVESNTVAAQVVQRTVSGVAWLDMNEDGIRDDGETLLSGITASLYRTKASDYDSSGKAVTTVGGVKLYTAYDVLGNEIEAVSTAADGSYSFTDLEAGTYYVVFTGTESYGLTVQDAGEDDTVDSDAAATVSDDGSTLVNAYISGIALPDLNEMFAYLYESNNNDAGFLGFSSGLVIRKVENGTETALSGAVFVLQNADGKYLTFTENGYTGYRTKVSENCYLTTGADGTVTVTDLPLGTYTLSEYQAPTGYTKTEETWSVGVKISSTEDGWGSYVTVDDESFDGILTVENEADTTTVTVTKYWKDNDNQDGLRDDVVLNLTGTVTGTSGEQVTVVTREVKILKNSSNWTYRFAALPAYAYGKEVTYSVTENAISGYETDYSAMEGNWQTGFVMVVTNTHTTETTEYTAVKVWDDDSDRDGLRPETIEVKLIGSDGTERVAKIAADDDWQYTFTDLPVYQNEGQEITYSLVESPVSSYERSVSDANENHIFTVTNTHEIRTVDIPVTKVWDDNEDQDGVRSESITVILTGSDGSVREAELTGNEDGTWAYTFEDLPYYFNGGAVIIYSLQEKEIDGYTDEVVAGDDGYSFTVTNNHIPAVVDVVVTKEWQDEDNQDGIRPESIHVTLNGSDGSVYETELTAENGYSYLFSGLPVYYDHGTLISYSVAEESIDGYEAAVAADETGYLFKLTNTHVPEVQSIPVSKVWDDADDQDGLRTISVLVTLTGSNGSVYEAELNEENDWSYVFEDVDVYFNEGETVEYTLTEADVDGYETEITAAGYETTSFTVTNIHEPETTEVLVQKLWNDDSNRDGVRPDSIAVTLYGSDGKSYSAELTEESSWSVIFTNLPVYYNHGEKITYTIEEPSAEGYETSVETSEDGYSFIITNSHEIERTSVSVTKVWDDAENVDGVRPESVEVILTGSDGNRYKAELNAGNDWSYSFTELPVYWNEGTVITYSLSETAVDGYTDEIVAGEDGYSFTVTNNHIQAVTDIVVSKEWLDDDNRDGIRPDSIAVTLNGSDGSIYALELNTENGFVQVLTALPVYWNEGEKITYSVTEEAVDGYESVVDVSEDGYAFVITNEHIPATGSINVTKVWVDENNKDGLRRDVLLTLTGSDGSVYCGTIEYDASEQTCTFTDLPVYADGENIAYTLTEAAMDGYTAVIEVSGTDFTVTNTHIVETEPETETETETEAESETSVGTETETESETPAETMTESETETEITTETTAESESETNAGNTTTLSSDPPQTGDSSRPLFWFLVALVGAGFAIGGAGMVIRRRRRA